MVRDKVSQKWFLVDVGASVSVVPPREDIKRTETFTRLLTANGTPITNTGAQYSKHTLVDTAETKLLPHH